MIWFGYCNHWEGEIWVLHLLGRRNDLNRVSLLLGTQRELHGWLHLGTRNMMDRVLDSGNVAWVSHYFHFGNWERAWVPLRFLTRLWDLTRPFLHPLCDYAYDTCCCKMYIYIFFFDGHGVCAHSNVCADEVKRLLVRWFSYEHGWVCCCFIGIVCYSGGGLVFQSIA